MSSSRANKQFWSLPRAIDQYFENKGSSVFPPAFPVWTLFQDNQMFDEGKVFFTEELQITNSERMIDLENQHLGNL